MGQKTQSPGSALRLTRKQRQFLSVCPGQGEGITALCERVGVGRATFYRWLNDDPDFRAAYSEIYSLAFEELAGRLVELGASAMDALAAGMDLGEDKGLRVRAASLVLSNMVSLRQITELDQRLGKIESAIEALKTGNRND